MQLQQIRLNPKHSVAGIYAQAQAIQIQARRQIASILTPNQTQKLTKLMVDRLVKREERAIDYY